MSDKNVADKNASGTVKVRLVKGLRGCQARHRLSVKALGLNKINDVRELKDSPSVRGLINQLHYWFALILSGPRRIHGEYLSPAEGARTEARRVGRGIGRPGQDLRPRPQGFVRARRQGQDQGWLRRRPDADEKAHAESRLPVQAQIGYG
jgi:large subunit ribosomal protein L30